MMEMWGEIRAAQGSTVEQSTWSGWGMSETSPVVGAGSRWLVGRWLIGPEIEKMNEYVNMLQVALEYPGSLCLWYVIMAL